MPKKKKRRKKLIGAVRAAIKSSGLTHYRLGKIVELSPSVLDRFVSGERGISLETAGKICHNLGYVLVHRSELDE